MAGIGGPQLAQLLVDRCMGIQIRSSFLGSHGKKLRFVTSNYRGIACGAGHFYAINFPKLALLGEGQVSVRFQFAATFSSDKLSITMDPL